MSPVLIPRTRGGRLALLLAAEAVLILVFAEVVIARSRIDMKLLEPLLYYQGADLEVYALSDDEALHYGLKPGARADYDGPRTVTINSFGLRDKPRSIRKPAGVTRIIVLGGSNTYGAMVDDAETYPAYLEAALNDGGRGRYEVWNAGVCAYVLAQNVRSADLFLERYSPDLLIFQFTNPGRRPFLRNQPYARFFDRDPALYRENLRFCWSRRFDFLARWGLLRTLVIAANRAAGGALDPNYPNGRTNWPESDLNFLAFRDFYARNRGRVRIALLIHPGGGLERTFVDTGVPVIDPRKDIPPGNDPQYKEIHPRAYVYRWYAGEIASALKTLGLLNPAQ